MSKDARNWAWALAQSDLPAEHRLEPDKPRLNSTEVLVLLAICELFNDKLGYAWPSQATIADMTCLTERGVWNAVQKLQQRGLVEFERRKIGTGKWAKGRYRLPLSGIELPVWAA